MLWPAVTFNRGLLVRLIRGLTAVLGTLCCAFLQRVSSSSRRASSMLHGLAGTIAGRTTDCFFEAVDESGTRHYVPTNYFTFYSAWLVHNMDYGAPEPETAFATEKPNGGAHDYELFKAGRTCDLNALRRPHRYDWSYRDRMSEFVRNYHRVALKISSTLGAFPYNAYPHHFYVPGILTEDFDRLDKRRIVAYIYRRESVCLGFSSGRLQRVVRGVAEHRIDVGQENSHDGVGR